MERVMYKEVTDSNTRLGDIDLENNRFIVEYHDRYKEVVKSRKELKELVSQKEAEIDNIYELVDKSDRYLDYETQTRYIVHINKMVEDEWYCQYVDEQYPVYVMAKNKKDAVDKALQYLKERLGEEYNSYLEPVTLDTYLPSQKGWKHESLNK